MIYRYEARDGTGRPVRGAEEAGSPADLRAVLRSRGLWVSRWEAVVPEGRARGARRVLSGRELRVLAEATDHLALLLGAGIAPAEAVRILSEEVEDVRFRRALVSVAARVREGRSLAEALSEHPRYFPELYVEVVRAGTEAGELPKVLRELAAYTARRRKLRARVVSALTYPAIMAAVGVVVVGFLLAFVVPRVTEVLLAERRALPWPTRTLLWGSALAADWGWALAGAVAAGAALLARTARTAWGERVVEGVLLRVPVLGTLRRKEAVARLAGTMATLLGSGLPVAQSLAVVRGAAGGRLLREEVDRLRREVEEGRSFSEALKGSSIFPPSVGFVAGVGEEAGELEGVFRRLSDSATQEVEAASERLTELLNPLLIVVLGLLVGFIVAAILLPITDFSAVR